MAGYIGQQPVPQATQDRYTYVAAASQTLFTVARGYVPNYIDVYLNGVKLVDGVDFIASNGTDFTLTVGAALDDRVEAITFNNVELVESSATGSGGDQMFYLNGQTVTSNYTIPAGNNAMTAGPITVASGVIITVGPGDTWTVV